MTKLIGPTISCEAPHVPVNQNISLAVVPYVEFGLLATDVVRLSCGSDDEELPPGALSQDQGM